MTFIVLSRTYRLHSTQGRWQLTQPSQRRSRTSFRVELISTAYCCKGSVLTPYIPVDARLILVVVAKVDVSIFGVDSAV